MATILHGIISRFEDEIKDVTAGLGEGPQTKHESENLRGHRLQWVPDRISGQPSPRCPSKYLQFRSRFGWSLPNLVASLRWNLFAYRDLRDWISKSPFEVPPKVPELSRANSRWSPLDSSRPPKKGISSPMAHSRSPCWLSGVCPFSGRGRPLAQASTIRVPDMLRRNCPPISRSNWRTAPRPVQCVGMT